MLKQVSYLGSSLQANLQIPGYNRHSIAPDFSLGLFWTSATIVNIVRMSNLTIVHSWTPPNPVAGDITAKITFSSDSSLAIIKTDSINPIQIMELSTFQIVKTVQIADTISEAHFLDSSNEVVVVFGSTATYVADLLERRQYELPFFPTTSLAADQDNNIFTCINSSLTQKRITFVRNADG